MTDTAQIEAVLAAATTMSLGLCDGTEPYVVPMLFGYRDRTVYMHCAAAGRKLDILRRNPVVCVEAHADVEFVAGASACGWTLRYRSVIGRGRASRVEDPDEKREALKVLMAHYAEGPFQFQDEILGRTEVIRIELDTLTGKQAGFGGSP